MGKPKLKEEIVKDIIKLRQRGNSLPEISTKLSVPKTTVFRYIGGVQVLPEHEKTWRGKWGGSLKRKLIKEEKIANEVNKSFTELSYKEKFLFICALYWAEGTKKDFSLSNTDPNLISIFMQGMRDVFHIQNERFAISVRTYEDLDKEKCLEFWSRIVKIPKEKFINVNVLVGKKKGKLEYGMCRVRVTKGGDILKKIKSVNRRVYDLFVPIA